MKLSHTCSIYVWLVASLSIIFSATHCHSDLLCQVTPEYWQKWRKKLLLGHNFFSNSLFLGQTITDCVSKQGGGNSIKIWGVLPSVWLIHQQYVWGLLWQYMYSQYYTSCANIWKYHLWNLNFLFLTVWPHSFL